MNFGKVVKEFRDAGPFPSIVIDNLFPDYLIRLIDAELAEIDYEDGNSFVYKTPLEVKVAREALPPTLGKLAKTMQSNFAINLLERLVGCPLLANPNLTGAGLHVIPKGGKLDLHLDHNRLNGLERKVNVIYWIHDVDWQEEWGGHLELWSERDGKPYECVRKILPKRNRMAIFECSEISFHGHPDPLKCPDDVARISLAQYFYTDQVSDVEARPKVNFYPRPTDAKDANLDALRLLRAGGAEVYT
jgi:hypothetical protein